MTTQLKRTYIIGTFFLVALVISVSLLGVFEERFNQQQWKANPTERYKMTDDLMESQLLINKSKAEVISILGVPFSKINHQKDAFIYNIGNAPSFLKSRKEHLLVVFINQKVDKVTLAYE